jgi:hypothetical protein
MRPAAGCESGDRAQQRGLARPRAAEQHEQLAAVDRQVEAVQRRRGAVADGQAGDLKQ